MRITSVLEILRGLAPESLAEPWDKVGLQVGDPRRSIRRAMLCIDFTPAVLREAVRRRAGLVVSYHPLIFKGLDGLREGPAGAWQEAVAVEAVRRRMAVYSPHTALDAASGGVNDWLAGGMGPGRVTAMKIAATGCDDLVKIAVFVPTKQVDKVRRAMADAGAGHIGHYRNCSFAAAGEGTFQGDATTHPAIGKPGRLERVPEAKLEMICRPGSVEGVLRSLKRAHPYETPAIDVYRVMDLDKALDRPATGPGRVVTLDRAVDLRTLVARVKRRLGVARVEVAAPGGPGGPGNKREIETVGLCAGAGGSLLSEHRGGLGAFVTGEMRHHDVLAAVQRGTAVILAGHTQTERPYLPIYRKRILAAGGGKGVDWTVSREDEPPGRFV